MNVHLILNDIGDGGVDVTNRLEIAANKSVYVCERVCSTKHSSSTTSKQATVWRILSRQLVKLFTFIIMPLHRATSMSPKCVILATIYICFAFFIHFAFSLAVVCFSSFTTLSPLQSILEIITLCAYNTIQTIDVLL